ncbi:PLP-dependent aminotransferase family protein [Thermogemmatispora carboxidivorans]|uniref:MocR-like pyridoxine biosynthesis transcription factor PdxR n=1 Tax=Thermogemmatispora carboxidivorans TaxID=1382306 RepID=UPI00069967E1|nr:PLP-dependent aminotransferase family protein [Thermogemmatispora carboxidivorans]
MPQSRPFEPHSRPWSAAPAASVFVRLDRSSSVPLYRQIYHQLREAILSGSLPEGTRLPTERALARELGVNRTTVMNAYNELASESLIEGHVGRGTLVRRSLLALEDEECEPEMPSWLLGLSAGESEVLGPDARLLSELMALAEYGGMISFASAMPEPGLLPAELFREICQEALLPARQEALGYCPVEGLQSLRQQVALRMRRRGVPVDAGHILILSGSTQGIGLVGRFLLRPGDEVVVEVPTYIGAIQAFRALGARVIGIPLDAEGLRLDLLESVLARHRPRLIYTLPTFQNPTGVVMSPERRRRLLQLCRRYQVPVLEDDTYGELYFDTPPPPPLKALDSSEQVIYLSTFSKMLAPGLRVAWLAGPVPMIERLSLHKQIFDLNTNAFSQWLVAEVLRRGWLDGHLQRLSAAYRRKRDLMLQAIERYWPREIRVTPPGGGFHLWCRLPTGLRARTLLREAAAEGVALLNGEPFHVDGGGQQYIRLSYAYPQQAQIEEGIRRIGMVLKRLLLQRGQELARSSPPEHIPMV